MKVMSFQPVFTLDPPAHLQDSSDTQKLISSLNLELHPEGGFYVLTDVHPFRVQNPFLDESQGFAPKNSKLDIHLKNPNVDLDTVALSQQEDNLTRAASSSIMYLLAPSSPHGCFHRNKSRTIHTLHRGRGRYVIIHADEAKADQTPVRVETFVVGHNVDKGERLQWIVGGGKYKASFLLPDKEGAEAANTDALLISETVVPGFDWRDHNYLTRDSFEQLVPRDLQSELEWLIQDE